jgi:hypothetical protein
MKGEVKGAKKIGNLLMERERKNSNTHHRFYKAA